MAGLRQPSGSARSGNFASSPPSIVSPQWTKTQPVFSPNNQDSSYLMEIEDLRQENQELQSNVEQLETIIASMEEDSMTQQQAMLNQQNLQKQLEEKMSDLEQRLMEASIGSTRSGSMDEEMEELTGVNQSLQAVQTEQDELIRDLEYRLHDAHVQLNSTANLQPALEEKDDEIDRLKKKVSQLHQQATDKVNRANIMLQERDAQIQQLKTKLDGETDHSHLLRTIQALEQQVQTMEVELVTRREQQGSSAGPESPVFTKSETKKSQRSAAPPPPLSEDLVRKLEVELQQAKADLNDQQAEFEKLLAKQAEEMSAEFENSLKKQAVDDQSHLQIAQLEKEAQEKTHTCESLKRLIEQQDEVVAEQKKVLEAQSSSARFAVENLQKMLKEAQQKLKDDVVRIQSKDAEMAALRDGIKQAAGAEQRLKTMEKDQGKMGAHLADVLSNLDVKSKEAESLKMQLQRLASLKEKELSNLKQVSQKDLNNSQAEFRQQHDEMKMKHQKLIKDSEMHMKKSWEQQDQIQRLSRELEDRTHSLDMKDKTVAKLSMELGQMQQNLNSAQTKMDRMENVIMTQENMLQESHNMADDLRVKVSGLERMAQETLHETELSAFEELAMVKNRMRVLEGEYEAMKEMVENVPSTDADSSLKIQKHRIKAQRSAPPPPEDPAAPPSVAHAPSAAIMASSDVRQLETELQEEKERADAAEHVSTQLKVDIIMFEEKYEEDWNDQLVERKHELIENMMATQEACRSAESKIKQLQADLLVERQKQFEARMQADDEKLGLQVRVDMLISKTNDDTPNEERKDQKILVLQLEEANGKVSDMQLRLDTLFEKNMAVENKAREAEMERKRAVDDQDKHTEEFSVLQREMVEAQRQVVHLESVVEKQQRSLHTLDGEVSGYQTDVKTRIQDKKNLKEQTASLMEIVEKDKETILGLQTDLDSLRQAKTGTDKELQAIFSKVAGLEEMLREATMQRDALQEEKTTRDALMRQTKDDANSLRNSRDELQEQVKLLKTEVVKAQQTANLYEFESKESAEEISTLKKSVASSLKKVADKDQEIRVLKGEMVSVKEVCEGLTSDLGNKAARTNILDTACAALGVEVDGLQKRIDLLEAEKKALEDQTANANRQVSQARSFAEVLEKENKEASMKAHNLTGELTHLNTRLEVMAAEKEALGQHVQMLQRKFEDAGRDLSGEQSEKGALEKKVLAMDTERDVMMASNHALEGKILQFEEKENGLNKAIDDLHAESRRLVESLEHTRTSLEAAHEDKDVLSKEFIAIKTKAADDGAQQAGALKKLQQLLEEQTSKSTQLNSASTAAQHVAYTREEEFHSLEATVNDLTKDLVNAKSQGLIMDNDYKVLEGKLAKAHSIEMSNSNELQKMAFLDDSLKTSAAEISKLTAEKASMQTQVAELQDLLEAKKAEFKLHDERLVSAEMEIQSLTKEKLSRSVQSAKMLADVHAAKSESNNLTMRLHASTQRFQDTKSRADTLEDEQAQLQRKLDQLQQENGSLTEKLVASQSEVTRVSSGKTDVSSENAALLHELQIYKTENEKMSKMVKSAEASEMLVQKLKQAWQEEKVNLEGEIRNLQAERVSLTSRLEAAQAAERELLQQKTKLTSELDLLKIDNEKLEAKATSFKSKLDKAENGRNSPTPSDAYSETGDSDLKAAQEQIADLMSQRELMVEELASRKVLLERSLKEAEVTMTGAETAVANKSQEIKKLSGENHRFQMELSMHRAEKEALNEDRQKLQRQMMALKADKESLEDKLKGAS